MSGGERQSIAIARAMQFEADLIILDEPTNNLGVEETWRVLQFIRDAKAAGPPASSSRTTSSTSSRSSTAPSSCAGEVKVADIATPTPPSRRSNG
jgi:ABC-type transport system involved in Fe-S cluster assembly fused permease/ATPase subunit